MTEKTALFAAGVSRCLVQLDNHTPQRRPR